MAGTKGGSSGADSLGVKHLKARGHAALVGPAADKWITGAGAAGAWELIEIFDH